VQKSSANMESRSQNVGGHTDCSTLPVANDQVTQDTYDDEDFDYLSVRVDSQQLRSPSIWLFRREVQSSRQSTGPRLVSQPKAHVY
jgi:hypothetical protein